MTRKKLGDLVVERGHVTEQELETALAYQRSTGKPLGEVLVLLGITTEDKLRKVLAEQQIVDAWDLRETPPSGDALSKLPEDFCLKHVLIPVKLDNGTLTVAMSHPGDLEVVDEIVAISRLRVNPVQGSDQQISRALQDAYGKDPFQQGDFATFVTQALEDIGEAATVTDEPDMTEEETRPVIGMVNQIFIEAVEMRASDIHIEPCDHEAQVRYRIDGRLLKVKEIPKSLLRMVVARIKIMAELDIANHRTPQDGRVEIKVASHKLDLRISVLPTQHGSRVVIRILDRASALRPLADLGFTDSTVELFHDIVTKPYGIVLVTGPTGSGKTTTLYAALNEVRDDGVNIMTCEDPIEYDLHGVSQSQVNELAGLTFPTQLRAILRQDPDIILVGEIRDQETAETAVRAALTGHLVLSTLHCNDAASAIPRLIDMGVEPYMLASSLIGVVAQRLLRVLCPQCSVQRSATQSERRVLAAYGYGDLAQVMSPVGCDACNGTGYYGRTAVHEVLPVTEDITELIVARSSADALRTAAIPLGFRPIERDALERVASGLTSMEEVQRVIYFDSFRRAPAPLSIAS